ncbi:helix-turn-helix domain-containing protein [Nocardia sp. 2]|uniref:Helix-turn-helix domain-containing protein n=1 Tax=Nocardia acididurans TaxID=2802282 RepID=A0ABS1MHV8_9NOCA|nr:helix-turn-helix domain-containing protein [Nocardia acididurans]
MARNSNGESTFSRIVKLLDAFAHGDTVLSVTELSSRTAMAAPTVSRLVGELVEQGWLQRTPDRRVRVGRALWDLAVRAAPGGVPPPGSDGHIRFVPACGVEYGGVDVPGVVTEFGDGAGAAGGLR